MAQQPQQHWAFCANPDSYRIEDAINDLAEDSWNVPKGDVRDGDRAVMWQAQGRHGAPRGIIALAEVCKDPEVGPDPNQAYWIGSEHRDNPPVKRVSIRYLRSTALPLWLDGPHHTLLSELAVSRGQGTVFRITTDQWVRLMAIIGGWPDDAPEVAEVTDAVEMLVGRRSAGQGFLADAATRRAVEMRAMALATQHFEQAGWRVEDVSGTESYDLRCTRPGELLHVEVKGTTANGAKVLLTKNEVEHARQQCPAVALCIVANIQVDHAPDGTAQAIGGVLRVIEPWEVDAGVLTPLAYAYDPPPLQEG